MALGVRGGDILASARHQAAMDDDPEELRIGPQGNLRITVKMTSRPGTPGR